MVHPGYVVVVASLVAAGLVVMVSARAASSATSPPTILTVVNADELEKATSLNPHALDEDTSASGSMDASGGDIGLFANNKIHIQNSRIVLTARDRWQLIQSIARAIVADQKKAMAVDHGTQLPRTTQIVGTPLVPITRDAFLYLKPSANASDAMIVRLGWRYPLSTWHTYKAFIATIGCDVQRVVDDYFYC